MYAFVNRWGLVWLCSLGLIWCYVLMIVASVASVICLYGSVATLLFGNWTRGRELGIAFCSWLTLSLLARIAAPALNAYIGTIHPDQPAT